ncbi:uncharacterized protein SCHCODRAFT_011981 [Schizophyllum commune H4-8]|uniref:Expressed protein n=1 Tax=Schizophyllum commune (strain H4-8 / FGSC 9210) TaxID=578458 RepID=D8QEB6_SCHCM|nr:uncharacterized protein SCHCODRAFT_011981 [Schizophyllum commune H4-8]KAI5888366.1 hypothetical protein SCHCODRAFT_011981 [Schizophyllum commune H4-8]
MNGFSDSSTSLVLLASCIREITSTINAVCPNLGTPHGTSPFCTLSPALSFLPPGSLISATATISASLVQNSGTNFDTARKTARWCATASSRVAAAHAKRGLKKTCGYVRERRSRSADSGALLAAGGSSTRRSFSTGTKYVASGLRIGSGAARITALKMASTRGQSSFEITSFIVVSTDTRSSAFACHAPTSSAAHCISSRLPLMQSNSNAMRTTLLRASDASVSDSRASSSTTRRCTWYMAS